MKALSFELVEHPKMVSVERDGTSVYEALAENNEGNLFIVTWKGTDPNEIFCDWDAPHKVELLKHGSRRVLEMENEKDYFPDRSFSEVKEELDYLCKNYKKNKKTILYLIKTLYYTVQEDINKDTKDV